MILQHRLWLLGVVVAAWLLGLLGLMPRPALALEGPPRIIDGDTLEVAGQRVRLHGIDAPELDQTCHRTGQAYACGKVARAALWDLVGGLDVICQPVTGAATGDAADAGAVVATCMAGDVSLNDGMVAAGWALADRALAEPYGALEDSAKAARIGLWSGVFEPPEAWRQGAR